MAFDTVNRVFKIFLKIGCPPKVLNIIKSYHDNLQGRVVFNGLTSETFNVQSGVKQGCVLAPTLFGIFNAVLLKHAFVPTQRASTSEPRRMVCQDFGLTISRMKTQVMGQDTDSPTDIKLGDHQKDVVHDFVYLGSTISDSLYLDAGQDKCISKAATTVTSGSIIRWNA
ncbi:uncharacterized protein [Haliotis asinina]|uniref:uncharacterized protein n=1 Tax=Haliotis asinina TaxID=109174 RepID=UPI0035319FFD